MSDLAPALATMTFFISVAAVAILRPLTKRLGELLVQMQRERQAARTDQAEIAQLKALLEQANARLELLEERLDFTERLLASGNRGQVRKPTEVPAGDHGRG